MAFDPRSSMFICGEFNLKDVNVRDNGGRIAMLARPADKSLYACKSKGGRDIDVFEIVEAPMNAGRNAGVFMGYWCPYTNNKTRYVTMSLNADYMFTAVMDGCTFGIGHAASDGTVIVSHSNAQELDTKKSKSAMIGRQKSETRGLLGRNAKLFQPKDYRKSGFFGKADVKAITFGVNENGRWRFYSHRYRDDTSPDGIKTVFQLRETVKLN